MTPAFPASPALSPQDRREAWVFFALAFLVIAAGFGLRDPWPADEPRFVLVARQMLESGDWWFPRRGAELYPDKPPLFLWLLALGQALTGSIRWSFLLPSLLAAMATLGLTYDLGRRLWNPRAGLLAATAVLVAPAFVYQAKRAQIDPVLVGLTTLALYGLLRHLLLGPAWRWAWLGGFAAGLGVVAKGVGFLPLFALLPFALMRRAGWGGLRPAAPGDAWRWAALAGSFLAAILLWFLPMLLLALTDGDPAHRAYLDELLFRQTVTRYVDAWHHHEPVWYYAYVIALFWAPFALLWPWLLAPWRDAWRGREARVWLPLAWGLLVLLFFTGSTGKRDMYILPALPAFALAAAPFLEGLLRRPGPRRALLAYAVGLAVLLLLAGGWALLGEPRFEARLLAERGLGAEALWLWGMLVAVGLLTLATLLLARRRAPLAAPAVLLGGLWLGWGFVVHPVLDDENSARAVMQAARERAGPETTLGLVAWREQNLLQASGPVAEFGFRAPWERQWLRAIAWLREAPAERRVFAEAASVPACVPEAAREPVGRGNRRAWVLVRAEGVAACPLDEAVLAVPQAPPE
ncbi:ArnT family glycosyltransferase [Silanimonas lenta]|uniref:ArnT family glycosyltransferase n=1 Tax=Silanimonas lenta TaxID=265429 RepID=UPI00040927F1|nr:glycosyltransferase family 39 protein [Silanimonas lenta]